MKYDFYLYKDHWHKIVLNEVEPIEFDGLHHAMDYAEGLAVSGCWVTHTLNDSDVQGKGGYLFQPGDEKRPLMIAVVEKEEDGE